MAELQRAALKSNLQITPKAFVPFVFFCEGDWGLFKGLAFGEGFQADTWSHAR